ncbi:MAG: hypothetical protein GY863_07930 [bacterium]|nr:hypothetical protein [bacterium]
MAGSRFKRVLDIDHSNYDALFWSTGVYGGWLGQPEAGHEFSRRLKEIDPLNPTSYIMEGWIFAYEGKFKKALVHSKKAYEMNINPAPVYKFHYSRYLAYNNKIGEALSILTDIDVETCNDSWDFLSLFMKYALNDDKNIIEKLRKLRYFDTIKWNFEWSHYVAAFFALLEEKDDAMNWLENAVDRGFINYPFLNEYDPFLENIRGEERFKKLMERVKHEWENFEV